MHDALLHVTSQFALHHQPITADWIALIFYFSGRLNQQDMRFFYLIFDCCQGTNKTKTKQKMVVWVSQTLLDLCGIALIFSTIFCLYPLVLGIPSACRLPAASITVSVQRIREGKKKGKKKHNPKRKAAAAINRDSDRKMGQTATQKTKIRKRMEGYMCIFLRFRIIDTSGQQVIIYFIWFSFTFPVFGVF